MRCVSAGAERREGVLCVAPAYVVSPQAKTKSSLGGVLNKDYEVLGATRASSVQAPGARKGEEKH